MKVSTGTRITLPNYGKHMAFVGGTGSGKSFLAEYFLKYYEHVLIIDTQQSFNAESEQDKIINTPYDIEKIINHPELNKKYRRVIYQPDLDYSNRDSWNWIFRTLNDSSTKFDKNRRIVYIDELFHLGYGPSFPDFLARGITTARQKGISYWIATQRPVSIPAPVLTEATRIYVFTLGSRADREKMADYTNLDKKEFVIMQKQLRKDHSFYEVDRINNNVQFFKPLKIN